jgi:hypothetical protein
MTTLPSRDQPTLNPHTHLLSVGFACLVLTTANISAVMAQQVTGVPGSPAATTTIEATSAA